MNTVVMPAGSGVQPHPLYSLAGAGLGTVLACAFLLWGFSHSLPHHVASQWIKLRLVTLPAAPVQRSVRTVPPPVRSPGHVDNARPVVVPKTPTLPPVVLPAPLNLSLPGITFAPPAASGSGFTPHVFNPYSDLAKALAAPPPSLSMQNGDSYRAVDGYTMVKSGGRCLALQNVQIGLSPSAHVTVAFGVPCPGDYRPSMANELKAWADKQAAKNPGGP